MPRYDVPLHPVFEVLWAFATLVGNADSPAQELAGLLGALAEGFKSEVAGGVGGSGIDPVTTCDVLWSFAKLGYPAHSLCEVMARDLVDQARGFPIRREDGEDVYMRLRLDWIGLLYGRFCFPWVA